MDLDEQVQVALDEARAMPPGLEKTAALRKAELLRNAADIRGFLFAKRGRPSESVLAWLARTSRPCRAPVADVVQR